MIDGEPLDMTGEPPGSLGSGNTDVSSPVWNKVFPAWAKGASLRGMTIILTPTAEYEVAARDGLWLGAADAERVTGWTLKPEGMCRDALCVPMPASSVSGDEVDVAAFWNRLGGPAIGSDAHDVWALGAPADERNAALEGLQAPDFTLPDIDGIPRTLSQLRGKKVFLATWASW